MASYSEFVTTRQQKNPSLAGLATFLNESDKSLKPSRIFALDYLRGEKQTPTLHNLTGTKFPELVNVPSLCSGRILVIEDIQPALIKFLGVELDVDPIFFAAHISTNVENIEKEPPPISLALLPSQIAEAGHSYIHFQQALDLGSAERYTQASYALHSDSNAARNVRRLPPVAGRQLALARACCSLLVKNIEKHWICLMLVDAKITRLIDRPTSNGPKVYSSVGPLYGGTEDFLTCSRSILTVEPDNDEWDNGSMLSCLLHYFRTEPPGFSSNSPSVLCLNYYPTRVALTEWIRYTNVMRRYFKHHEYSLLNVHSRLHNEDIVDLQRWRRRCWQSQLKLEMLARFIRHWQEYEVDIKPWTGVLDDIKHINSQLDHYNQAMEQMVLVATSMVQLLDARHSMEEAAYVKRLAYIALVFAPLSWVASLFSMSEKYSPGNEEFWVYAATAVPVLLAVLLLSALQHAKWSIFGWLFQAFQEIPWHRNNESNPISV